MKFKLKRTPSSLPSISPTVQPSSAVQAPSKLKLLVTIVDRRKADFYMDVIQSFEVNMQMALAAEGTAPTEALQYLGLKDSQKTVILSVIREDKAPAALSRLEEKFRTIKNGKGIAYTIPMTGTVGVAIYRFLSNSTM